MVVSPCSCMDDDNYVDGCLILVFVLFKKWKRLCITPLDLYIYMNGKISENKSKKQKNNQTSISTFNVGIFYYKMYYKILFFLSHISPQKIIKNEEETQISFHLGKLVESGDCSKVPYQINCELKNKIQSHLFFNFKIFPHYPII